MDWITYAITVVKEAIDGGRTENNPEAITAARALISYLERGHASYHNTQFAIAAFFLEPWEMTSYAWRMVANGLGGYWQFETHNGGTFSVTAALQHLSLLTAEEAGNPQQFVGYETHSGCHYFVLKNELLTRLVKKFELPTVNPNIGGRNTFSEKEHKQREWLMSQCFPGVVSDTERFGAGLRSM